MSGDASGSRSVRVPAYQEDGVTVFLGDAREVMADLPAESVDCVITSPPYWGLRDFGVPATVWGGDSDCRHRWSRLQRGRRKDMLPSDATTRRARVGLTDRQDAAATNGGRLCVDCDAWLGSLGLEPTPQLFVTHLVELFRGVRRLLKPTGLVWLNLGDTFYQAPMSRARSAEPGLKPKDLVGVPWRTALALQADGWFLRSDIVWHKQNPVPEPAHDRPRRAHELLFLLSREPRYHYDAEAVREPAVTRANRPLGSVWTIASERSLGAHTATFPAKLVEPCVLAGSSAAGCCSRCGRPWERVLEISYEPLSRRHEPRKDRRVFELEQRKVRRARTTGWRPTCACGAEVTPSVVLDPFAGTGTTLEVARRHGRHAIAIELNPQYVDLIKRRVGRALAARAEPEPPVKEAA